MCISFLIPAHAHMKEVGFGSRGPFLKTDMLALKRSIKLGGAGDRHLLVMGPEVVGGPPTALEPPDDCDCGPIQFRLVCILALES